MESPSRVPSPPLVISMVCGAGSGPPAVLVKFAVLLESAIAGSLGGVTPPPPSSPPQCRVDTATAARKRAERTLLELSLELIIVRRPVNSSRFELHDTGVFRQLVRSWLVLRCEREGTGQNQGRQEATILTPR